MKVVVALFVFFLALGLTIKTIAADQGHGDQQTEHSGGHNELSDRMNSLFPEKQKNTAVSARPKQTQLEEPKFLAKVPTGTVQLKWTETSGATNYHVQVATDPNFKWLLVNDHWIKNTNYDFTAAEPGKRYFWRVASVKNDNISMYTKSLFVSSAFDSK